MVYGMGTNTLETFKGVNPLQGFREDEKGYGSSVGFLLRKETEKEGGRDGVASRSQPGRDE